MKNTFTDPFIKRPPIPRNIRALIMRISQVYILIQVTAIMSVAKPGSSQSIETTAVKLEINNEPLTKVFEEIEKQTDFLFSWTPEKVNTLGRVSIAQGQYTVVDALEIVLKGKGLRYKQEQNYILVFPEDSKQASQGVVISEYGDSNAGRKLIALISGTVKDASTQEPLAGVNIIVKGTTKGTTTEADGKFAIDAEEKDVLVFSFIGFKSFEAPVGGRSVIDVLMEVDATALKEVVVNAGYWRVNKKNGTGNISKVSIEEIQKQPISNPLQALQGRMPGVVITQDTGVPGGGIKVQIRGVNSISSGNDPLYIVDGVPFSSSSLISRSFGATLAGGSPLSTINPADIESIEVLKDADATAIYGSRGANGVILITTRKGKSSKGTSFDVSLYKGFSTVASRMDLLNTAQYIEMRNEAYSNDNISPSGVNAIDLLNWDTTRYTDWQEKLVGGTSQTTNFTGSILAGNTTTQFLLNGGYYNEGTVFPGDFSYKRGSGHFNLTHKPSDERFHATFSIDYISEISNLPRTDFTNQALLEAPNAPDAYDDNGDLNWGPLQRFDNPYAKLLNEYKVETSNFRSSGILGFFLAPGLEIKTNVGYSKMQTVDFASLPIAARNPRLGITTGSSHFGNGNFSIWNVEPQVEYQMKLKGSKVEFLLGATFQENSRDARTVSATGYTNDALLGNIQAASSTSIVDASTTKYRYNALFGRIYYGWKEKLLFNVTGRRDGSSRFGPGKRFANFGAIGAAWIFSNETFVRNLLPFLSFGKLRTSYGKSGNDQIGDYGYLDSYSTTQSNYQGVVALVPTRLANSNYSWETNNKFEAAIELGFLEDRIQLSASYYVNRSTNQLVGFPLSTVTGFSSVQANLSAVVENRGLETELNALVIAINDFSWKANVNFTIPRNELVRFPGLEGSSYTNRLEIGRPLSIEKVYQYTGLNVETGVYQFEDFDGDGTISTPNDRKAIIDLSKTFYGGINNSFQYKGWQLDFFFQFVKQNARNYFASFLLPGTMRNMPTDVMARWENPGDETSIQQFTQTTGPALSAWTIGSNSTMSYGDASFIRLKNISLSYQVPTTLSSKVHLKATRIFAQCQNMLTITNYLGLDPETTNFLSLPPLKTIAFGFQLTF